MLFKKNQSTEHKRSRFRSISWTFLTISCPHVCDHFFAPYKINTSLHTHLKVMITCLQIKTKNVYITGKLSDIQPIWFNTDIMSKHIGEFIIEKCSTFFELYLKFNFRWFTEYSCSLFRYQLRKAFYVTLV